MKRKVFSFLLVFAVTVLCISAPAHANSAQTYWKGVAASGAIIADKECPITVEHELLTFDIQNLPENYYNPETFGYTGKVTAEYTFKNPADYTVTASLAFPFGTYPSYLPEIYSSENGAPYDDTAVYGVTVNGEEISKTLRHTYTNGNYTNADLTKIADSYIKGSFFRADMPVTKYTYKASGIEKEPNSSAYASFTLTADISETRTVMIPNSGYDYHDGEKTATAGTWVQNGDEIIIYAIGKPYEKAPQFTVYFSGAEEEAIGGDITLISTETMTYEDLVFLNYSENSPITRIDWFNAMLAMHESADTRSGLIFEGGEYALSPGRDSLMRWYLYEITLAPGETLKNTVTVPIYPDIDGNYIPPVYSFEYLLSPASTWKSFGSLDIVFNTPYNIIESGFESIVRTENGYSLSLDSLPDKELEFKLCTSENPEKQKSSYFLPIEMIISFSIIAGIAAVIAAVVIIIKKRKKKNNP